MSRWSTTLRFAALVAAFFALYALTAQRGVGWGDSGEFQHRILDLPDGILGGCESFAVAHPLYVALGKLLYGKKQPNGGYDAKTDNGGDPNVYDADFTDVDGNN